jgi:hypothetical protein
MRLSDLTPKQRQIRQRFYQNARSRAKKNKLPFNLTIEYLESIATEECPIFKVPFQWGQSGLGRGVTKENCPTLDRILPHKGYVIGNVAFLSHRANRIKDNASMEEMYKIADWIWDQLNAQQK